MQIMLDLHLVFGNFLHSEPFNANILTPAFRIPYAKLLLNEHVIFLPNLRMFLDNVDPRMENKNKVYE